MTMAEPGGRRRVGDAWPVVEPMNIELHASTARNEKANVRALAGSWTTWLVLCRAIVADGFVQMVHIPLVVLWVRNVLPWDSSRPWKQGPT